MPEVYMVTNLVTGDRYIGSTRKTVEKRRRGHMDRSGRGETGIRLFWTALRDYGPKAFKWETLRVFETYDEAREEEKRLIIEMRPEYNIDYIRREMSDEQRAFLSDLGRKNIEKWRQYSHLGPKASSRKVRCLDDGIVYDSASDASRAYSVAKSALIELCLGQRGRKTVGGLRFEYVDEP